jgi:hypothetical protein
MRDASSGDPLGRAEAMDAAWRTAQMFVPIVATFMAFYFSPGYSTEDEDKKIVHIRQGHVAITTTIGFRILAIAILALYVPFPKYSFSDKVSDSFLERVSMAHKFLLFLNTLFVGSTVTFLLKGMRI